MKDQIAKIRTDLPRTIDEPIINRIDIEGLPIVTYAASAPGMTVEQLSWFIDDTVARELQSIKGVGEVKRFGGVDREIRVSLDPEKLLALGVTAATGQRAGAARTMSISAAAAANSPARSRRSARSRAPKAGGSDGAADRAVGRAARAAGRTRRR